MQVQVKFTVFGSCSAFGNFGPGDTARVSPAMAEHLVEVARCAEYVNSPVVAVEVKEEPKPRKRKGK